ncbi:hypothetical protein [Gloeothece verrucosa]|nr:hypothetical protein [Gloeothece verrucosa]
MVNRKEEIVKIQQETGLKPRHFADLIRTAQIVCDPGGGVSGRILQVDWSSFGIPDPVAENLKILGQQYQYASPHVPIDTVWQQLTPDTRNWFMEHKEELWQIEEAFPALDED